VRSLRTPGAGEEQTTPCSRHGGHKARAGCAPRVPEAIVKTPTLTLLLLATLLPGCISPWAVMPGGCDSYDHALLPPGTEVISVPVGHGDSLRGLFVPGVAGAPVVLHLQEAMGSATLGCSPERTSLSHSGYPVLWDLQDLGYASVMLDYRGVGASTGTRHIDHLEADAVAMWETAVRYAGSPERVLLRSISLGGICAGALLSRGARPAAWTLIAPVDGETVATNVLYGNLWRPVAWLADCLATKVSPVPLLASLERAKCPLLCYLPEKVDPVFLTAAEHAAVAAKVRALGGECVDLNDDHVACAGGGHWLRPEERRLLHSIHGSIAPTAARVAAALAEGNRRDVSNPRTMARLQLLASNLACQPKLMLAAARSSVPLDPLLQWAAWLERRVQRTGEARSLAQWQSLLCLEDRSGPLRADLIARLAPFLLARDLEHAQLDDQALVRALNNLDCSAFYSAYYGGTAPRYCLGANVALGLSGAAGTLFDDAPPEDWARRALLTLRKARGSSLHLHDNPRTTMLESPWKFHRELTAKASFAVMPSYLAGQPKELLRKVSTAEITTTATSVDELAEEQIGILDELLMAVPWLCEAPKFLSVLLYNPAAVSIQLLPKTWLLAYASDPSNQCLQRITKSGSWVRNNLASATTQKPQEQSTIPEQLASNSVR